MLKRFVLLLIVFTAIGLARERPKIGLVLSGGGAKGFAHVGTLKMLDSLKIPVDYIAGTSMGGLVGGLYAMGYKGIDLEQVALQTDWLDFFNDQPDRSIRPYIQKRDDGHFQLVLNWEDYQPKVSSGILAGQKVSLKLSRLTHLADFINDFNQLAIPYRCITTDLYTGREVVLAGGSLAVAMRATMSIPTVFSPVIWGDSLLVDGGLVNNLPVDVVRGMGADVVISVDVSENLKQKGQLQSLLDIFGQTINLTGYQKLDENRADSDLLISPDISQHSAADFEPGQVRAILRSGERAAQQSYSALQAFRAKYVTPYQQAQESPDPVVFGVSFTGDLHLPFRYFYDLFKVTPGQRLNSNRLDSTIAILKAKEAFSEVSYSLNYTGRDTARIELKLTRFRRPEIRKITITGNRMIPTTMIRNWLTNKLDERLDLDRVEENITHLYSLGYFETIRYELTPIDENSVELAFIIDESAQGKVKFGLQYDDYYKLVAKTKFEYMNFPFNGVLFEEELHFSGYTYFNATLSYPSMSFDLFAFPYVGIEYFAGPVLLYGRNDEKIARYSDRYLAFKSGIGFQLGTHGMFNVELMHKLANVETDIAMPDTIGFFPDWDDKLGQINAKLNFDTRDDTILPKTGELVEGIFEYGSKSLGSEFDFIRGKVFARKFIHISSLHNLQLSGYYFYGSSIVSTNKFYLLYYSGGPQTFAGLDYQQLLGPDTWVLRADWRYKVNNSFYLKFIYNYALIENYQLILRLREEIAGMGLSLKALTLLGPLEFTLSYGPDSVYNGYRNRFLYNVSFGLFTF
jgi:predicted acylesterase/phospholipase RssA